MKISDLIVLVDIVKPNSFSKKTKISWLNDVEGMVWTQIYLRDPVDFVGYDDVVDKELGVKPPHHRIYSSYLCAMIDFANGEYDKYQNTMVQFNEQFGAYSRWYALNFRPADNIPGGE